MHIVTYKEDGTILTVGTIDPGYAGRVVKEGVLYTDTIPDDTDIVHNYKIQNGIFVFDPVEDEPILREPRLVDTVIALQAAQNDTDAMVVDQEYRLTVLELNI